MPTTIDKWINAANALANNQNEQVLCPECSTAYLSVQNIHLDNGIVAERMIYCNQCKAKNYLRINSDTSGEII